MRKLILITMILLPVLLLADMIAGNVDMAGLRYNAESRSFEGGTAQDWTFTTAPGSWQMPVREVCLMLPAGAEVTGTSFSVSGLHRLPAPPPEVNTPYSDGSRVLAATGKAEPNAHAVYQGMGRWGEVRYARFAVYPALYNAAEQGYEVVEQLQLQVSYRLADGKTDRQGNIPPTFSPDRRFLNLADLSRWYRTAPSRTYDYLIITTPQLYAAAAPLVSLHQGQGMTVQFTDIGDIQDTVPGATLSEKIRNYLISEYTDEPFSYLLLIGDVDVIPCGQLTPEPNGTETVPSDFYYSDLTSDFDSNDNGLLGEYSAGPGFGDYGMDFTPELFVGRIPYNTTNAVTQISNRIVSFEGVSAAWKHHALLPAAYLNYANEDGNPWLATDGATPVEYAKSTVFPGWQTTTLYETTGVVTSTYTPDYPISSDNFENLLTTQNWGLINWSAHGSATSSARKVWQEDANANLQPDADEMMWYGLVSTDMLNNLTNQSGTVVFCASCNNGMLDYQFPSLGETLIRRKAVADIAATRTGWYKIGWANPGWGGLSSYNYHFLENYVRHGYSVGQAHGWTNWLHTQYCLFGDPVDSDGIVWPELQNVYTYLLFGDPAVGYQAPAPEPTGSILIWEPLGNQGNEIVNGLLDLGNYNVVYTHQLVENYDYLNNFDAVFCLFGFNWGGTGVYSLVPGSYQYTMLLDYLQNGGKLYLEGLMSWDGTDPFWSRFGTIAPFDHLAFIENIRHSHDGLDDIWGYDGWNEGSQALAVNFTSVTAQPLFYSFNQIHVNDIIGIWNQVGNSRTVSSSFELSGVVSGVHTYPEFLAVILDTLGVVVSPPTVNQEEITPIPALTVRAYPNPFSSSLKVEINADTQVQASLYNIKGQRVLQQRLIPQGGKAGLQLDNASAESRNLPAGVYLLKVRTATASRTVKLVKVRT